MIAHSRTRHKQDIYQNNGPGFMEHKWDLNIPNLNSKATVDFWFHSLNPNFSHASKKIFFFPNVSSLNITQSHPQVTTKQNYFEPFVSLPNKIKLFDFSSFNFLSSKQTKNGCPLCPTVLINLPMN